MRVAAVFGVMEAWTRIELAPLAGATGLQPGTLPSGPHAMICWCEGRESNPHVLAGRQPLKLVCLPFHHLRTDQPKPDFVNSAHGLDAAIVNNGVS
jgi:hypothetical protein